MNIQPGFLTSIVIACAMLIWPNAAARADAPTHEMRITSAKTSQADCGGGSCSTTCQIYVEVRGLGRNATAPFQIAFHYKHPAMPTTEGLNQLSFQFPDGIEANASKTTTNHQIGISCRAFVVRKITAQCFDRYRCPYAKIRILPFRRGPVIQAGFAEIDQPQ